MSTNGQQFCEGALWRTARRRDFSYQWAEKMLVRYVENPPLAMLEEAAAYLTGASGCAALTADGKAVSGAWRTVEAWLEETKPDRQGLRVLRLYHSCVPAANAVADTAYTAGNNCTFRVTHTPYFRLLTLPVPPAGTSGVTYETAGERRDPETGLWMCTVVRREQLTTTTGVIIIGDDTLKTVYQQGWHGVRTGNKDHTGAAVALWPVNDSVPGTRVRDVFIQKNDNCTVDIVQQKTVTKQGVTGGRSSVDAFSSVTAVEDVAAEALGAAPEPANGVTVEHKDDLDEDGLRRRVKTTETEREVDGAVTDTAADAAETVTESESRGKAAPLSAPEDPEGTVSRVTNTKSKAGRWTQRLRQTVAKLWAEHTLRRVRDAFGSEEETRSDGVATADLPAAPEAAAGGVWNEQLLQQRKDRKWDVRAVAHTEDDVAVAESVAEENPLESVTETESVGADPAAAPACAAGYIRRAVSSLTRGGKWKRRTVERRENAYALQFAARETFEETVTAEAGQAGSVALDAAGGGTYRTASASLTAGGLLRYLVQTIAEKLWTKTYTAGEDYFTKTEQERGVAATFTVSAADGTAVQASADVTPGGLLRYAKNTETAKAAKSWTLLDQTTSKMRGNAFERVRVKLYSNSELSTAKADVAAFVAASRGFVDFRGATGYHYYWEHDIAFGLHVNKLGKWDGTVTIRAHAVLGWAQTQTS
jgi:hypothetical protein